MEKQTNENTREEATQRFHLDVIRSPGAGVNNSHSNEHETRLSASSMNSHDQIDELNDDEGHCDDVSNDLPNSNTPPETGQPKAQAQQDKQSDEKKPKCLRKFCYFCHSLLEQKLTLLLFFLLPWVTGLALIVAVHVNSDQRALEVTPRAFHCYTVFLILVYMLWELFKSGWPKKWAEKCPEWFQGCLSLRRNNRPYGTLENQAENRESVAEQELEKQRQNEQSASQRLNNHEEIQEPLTHEELESDSKSLKPLIPVHLLNGIALFGVANSVFQIASFVDIIKCRKTIPGLDVSYIFTSVMETLFVFCQIYVFYRLSQNTKKNVRVSKRLTMFTLAVNLTIWAGYFTAGAANHPDLKDVRWLRHYYYGLDKDLCASLNNTGSMSRKLHDLVSNMVQYKFTFAMEYSLLASALLLRLWRTADEPKTVETNTYWTVWRFGFIAGLFILPVIACIAVYSEVNYSPTNTIILHGSKVCLFLLISLPSFVGCLIFKKHYTPKKDAKVLKVDIILLCLSSVGFVVLDLFTLFAAAVEHKSQYRTMYGMIIAACVFELLAVSLLTVFITRSYIYEKLRNTADDTADEPADEPADEMASRICQKSRICQEVSRILQPIADRILQASGIRQISSFCLIVSLGFWAMRTYTFRSDRYFDYAGRKYFETSWFSITQFSTPLCIFYHFHCAACLSTVIARFT